LELGHLLHSPLSNPPDEKQRQLKSRHLSVPSAQELLNSNYSGEDRVDQFVTLSKEETALDSVISYPTSVSTLLEYPSQDQHGSG